MQKGKTKGEPKYMKYMFASDIHGSAYYCQKMLDVSYRLSAQDSSPTEVFLIGLQILHRTNGLAQWQDFSSKRLPWLVIL